MNNLHEYLIEPLAPLVFRSGKPFGSEVGVEGANFPVPASLAGLMRTVYADQQHLAFTSENLPTLLAHQIKGPFLIRYQTGQEQNGSLLLPKPADALYMANDNGQKQIIRLKPQPLPDGVETDLPAGLTPVQMEQSLKGKPIAGPQFWALSDFLLWQQGQAPLFTDLERRGLTTLPIDTRTHVAIDSSTQAGADGKLFQTASLDLHSGRCPNTGQGWETERLGFWAASTIEATQDLVTFGGERRLSRLYPLTTRLSQDSANAIPASSGLKVTLLTPAIFTQGSLPGWLNAIDTNQTTHLEGVIPDTDVKVRLVAQAIERWQPISGFDLKAWKPKVMRKSVAAGSVFWFEVISGNAASLSASLWMHAISDLKQDRLDGFGLISATPWQSTP